MTRCRSSALANAVDALVADLGHEAVIQHEAELEFYGQDIRSKGHPPLAVVRPIDRHKISAICKICSEHDVPIIPRGGGLSYSSGYIASFPAVLLDLAALDQIIEISPEDMFVTVEPGVTWAQLDAALEPLGLRTPFWGPLSGKVATVGGTLAQNSVWWGSGSHGTAAESVLGLGAVLADGTELTTGNAGSSLRNTPPFLRMFGPDLTGLFLADAGALAIKISITLRLIRRPKIFRFASFDFAQGSDALRSVSAIGREQIAAENFMFDPYLSAIRVGKSDGLGADIDKMWRVFKSRGPIEAIRIALRGRSFAKTIGHSQHLIIEADSEAEANARLGRARQLAVEHQGKEIAPSIPKVTMAEPFPFPRGVLGPSGERWVGRHALLAHSRVEEMSKLWNAELEERASRLEHLQIQTATLCCTASSNVFLFEVHMFWPDSAELIHERTLGDKIISKLATYSPNAPAREMVDELFGRFTSIAGSLGGGHMQIGRAYPFSETRSDNYWSLVEQIKQAVDPKRILNPGALGLDFDAGRWTDTSHMD